MLKQKQKQEQKVESVQDLAQVIDEAYSLDREIKAKKKSLDNKKQKIKEAANKLGMKEMQGIKSKVTFSDSIETEIDPHELFQLCQDFGMEQMFFDLVKPKVTDVKKRLGELQMEQVAKTNYKENAKMTFKKR